MHCHLSLEQSNRRHTLTLDLIDVFRSEKADKDEKHVLGTLKLDVGKSDRVQQDVSHKSRDNNSGPRHEDIRRAGSFVIDAETYV